MRIGFIEDTHLHGGTQIWVLEAIQAFIQEQHEVSLIAPAGSWIADLSRTTGASITTYDWDEIVHEDRNHRAAWQQALRDCDVAVCTVHPPRADFHCAIFAARCIKEAGLSTHLIPKTGTIVPEYLREFYLPDETIRSSVIAIADFTRKYLVEAYNIPSGKVDLIYQGTDTKRFRQSNTNRKAAKKRYPLPDNAFPVLGSIGSFEHRKGHPILFEALVELVRSGFPDIHLLMVGDGPDETMLIEMANSLDLGRNVSFFPFTDKPNYIFERIDMTVLPSLHKEGLPNVLLESMSMGVPVVSSNVGGIPEIVRDGETGFVVEPGNKTALAGAIRTMCTNQKAYLAMKIKARKLMVNQFDKVTQFNEFAAHFDALINTN